MVASIFEVIQRLNSEGVTILLVEQNASLALEHGRYSYVLEEGKVVDEGLSTGTGNKDFHCSGLLGDGLIESSLISFLGAKPF